VINLKVARAIGLTHAQAASYIDRILKSANPADLSVHCPAG
jgi:hypothetical protein